MCPGVVADGFCVMLLCARVAPPNRLNNKMIADALHGDTLAMFLAMQQNPLLAGGAGANMRPGPVLPPLSLPPRVPHMPAGRPHQPGQPTPEQMMMANAEISRCGLITAAV